MRKVLSVVAVAAAATVVATAGSTALASGADVRPATGPTGAALGSLTTLKGDQPLDVLVDPASGDIYVTNTGSNSVSVFAATNKRLASVPVGTAPRQMAVDDARGYLYVTNFGSRTLSVLRTSKPFSVVATITVGANPDSVAVDPDTGEVYVTDSDRGNGPGTVSVIASSTWKVVRTIDVGRYPSGIAYDPGNGDIYANNEFSQSISIIDPRSNTVVGDVTLPDGARPHGITVDPDLGMLYVAEGAFNAVTAISDVTNEVVYTVAAGQGAHHIVSDPVQDMFVTDYNAKSVTELLAGGVKLGVTTVCRQPDGIAYDAADNKIYVACAGSNDVAVMADLGPLGGLTHRVAGAVHP